jgi:hypothetical protein
MVELEPARKQQVNGLSGVSGTHRAAAGSFGIRKPVSCSDECGGMARSERILALIGFADHPLGIDELATFRTP